MILKLIELYNDEINTNDLCTYLFEYSGIKIYKIDLPEELRELESNEHFMKIWKESGSKEYSKMKYCLCKRPEIEILFEKDEFIINDGKLGTCDDKLYKNFIVIDLWNSNKIHTYLLLNKRRFKMEFYNDRYIKIGEH